MKIYYSPYFLKPKQRLNAISVVSTGTVEPNKANARNEVKEKDSRTITDLKNGSVYSESETRIKRDGVLLKVEWEEGLIGYSDLHPWGELGDLPWTEQLLKLRQQDKTPQIQQSLKLARFDAELRQKKENAFEKLNAVKNNFLLTNGEDCSQDFFDNLLSLGFSTVKVKVGMNLSEEKKVLEKTVKAGLKLRLDFNASSNPAEFSKFISSLPIEILSQIEYVEDPFPFDESLWSQANKLVPLALDNEIQKVNWDQLIETPFSTLILKPAKVDIDAAMALCKKWNLKATVTSYMDHALGLSHAACVAMNLKEKYGDMIQDSGCLTQHMYQTDSFFSELIIEGPYLKKVNGTGAGFDKLLEELPWIPL